jgi:hypothetical protein
MQTFNGYYMVDLLSQSTSIGTNNIDYELVTCDDSGNKSHQEKTKPVINI